MAIILINEEQFMDREHIKEQGISFIYPITCILFKSPKF